jgi:hypothetical protein
VQRSASSARSRARRSDPARATAETLASGFQWVEGPVWDVRTRSLFFSDVIANVLYRWQEGTGATPFLAPSGYAGRQPFAGREPGSNGLVLDAEGRLILCEHGDRRVTRLERDGSRSVLIDRYHGKRLNSPNDVFIAPNGDLYVSDPPFGLPLAPSGRAAVEACTGCGGPGAGAITTRCALGNVALARGDVLVANADRANPVWLDFLARTARSARARCSTRARVAAGLPGVPDGSVSRRPHLPPRRAAYTCCCPTARASARSGRALRPATSTSRAVRSSSPRTTPSTGSLSSRVETVGRGRSYKRQDRRRPDGSASRRLYERPRQGRRYLVTAQRAHSSEPA